MSMSNAWLRQITWNDQAGISQPVEINHIMGIVLTENMYFDRDCLNFQPQMAMYDHSQSTHV